MKNPLRPSPAAIIRFRAIVYGHYKQHGRSFPWRSTRDPYSILVSEIMLQQTQVDRVVPKYEVFIARFPTLDSLATSSLPDVLHLWKGLGYNRRAKHLREAARTIMSEHGGIVSKSYEDLLKIPGIGPATAGDIMAFAFNKPAVVLETNIETALIHHFFSDNVKNIPKNTLRELAERTMDTKYPRTWYYALMDYGAHIKKTVGNASRRAASYKKQSTFNGSNRQIRARILFLIHEKNRIPKTSLLRHYTKLFPDTPAALQKKIPSILAALEREGMISLKNGAWYIPE